MNKIYYLPVETPEGMIELEVAHKVVHKDDDGMRVNLLMAIRGEARSYRAATTEDALILLARDLPKGWRVKSCISCRFGHFCPVGNADNELFCVTDFVPKRPRDLWHVTEDEDERKNRSRTLFASCGQYQEQTKDYFTYSDFYSKMNEVKP